MLCNILTRDSVASVQLDLIRGLASLMVLVGHAVGLFFELPKAGSAPWGGRLVYTLTAYGHEAVMVFFVLSGFLVGLGVIRSIESGRWSWSNYLVSRLSRLYIVLVPALILGLSLDRIGISIFGDSGIYGGGAAFNGILPGPVALVATWPTFFGNLFFLQTIKVWTLGSNGPLWSLSNEFWYYIAFPCIWIFWRGSVKWFVRLIYLVLFLSILILIGKHASVRFCIWLLGAAIAIVPRMPRIGAGFLSAGAWCIFATVVVATHFSRIHASIVADSLIGISFAIAVLVAINRPEREVSVRVRAVSRQLSEASYSTYLLHLPFLCFLHALMIGNGSQWSIDGLHLTLLGGVLAICACYISLIWWLFESRTDRLRRWLSGVLTKKVRAP